MNCTHSCFNTRLTRFHTLYRDAVCQRLVVGYCRFETSWRKRRIVLRCIHRVVDVMFVYIFLFTSG